MAEQKKKSFDVAEFIGAAATALGVGYEARRMFRSRNIVEAQKKRVEHTDQYSSSITETMNKEIEEASNEAISKTLQEISEVPIDEETAQAITDKILDASGYAQDAVEAKFQDQLDSIDRAAQQLYESSIDMDGSQKVMLGVAATGAAILTASTINALRNEETPSSEISTGDINRDGKTLRNRNDAEKTATILQ